MRHSFEVTVAQDVGISAAIVLNHISCWCANHAEKKINFHDGRYWMYDSQAAIAEALPYISLITVKRAIATLVDNGYLVTGNFNRHKYDKTKWYALTDKSLCIYAESAKAYAQNQPIPSVQIEPMQPIPTPPPAPAPEKPKKAKKPKEEVFDPALFEAFWKAYPRKVGKDNARKAWGKLKVDKELHERIMDGLRRSIQFDHTFRDVEYTPHASTWLNGKRWEDEHEFPKPQAVPPTRNSKAFEELKRIAAEPGVPPPPLPDSLKWR